MLNGETFFTYDVNTRRVIRMCVINDRADYVSAVEIYGTTTCNVKAVPRYDVFSTPREAFEAMKEYVNKNMERDFEEDYEIEEKTEDEER